MGVQAVTSYPSTSGRWVVEMEWPSPVPILSTRSF